MNYTPYKMLTKDIPIAKKKDFKDVESKWFHCTQHVPEPGIETCEHSQDVLAYNGDELHIAYYYYGYEDEESWDEGNWYFNTGGNWIGDPETTIWQYLPKEPKKKYAKFMEIREKWLKAFREKNRLARERREQYQQQEQL